MKESRTNWKHVYVALTQQTCWVDMSVFRVNIIRLLCGYSKYFCPDSVGGMPEIEVGHVNLKVVVL
jgi:hypothetical protein